MNNPYDPAYAAAVAQIKAAGAAPADPLNTPLATARAAQDNYFAFLAQDLPPVAEVRNVQLVGPAGAFEVRLVYPATSSATPPAIVFIRGGGWWAGTLDSHERTMRLLANDSGCVVCGVDYHCAPEEHFPAQRDEVMAAVAWLRVHQKSMALDATRLALAGESAGANLSVVAAAKLNAVAPGTVSALALFYGNFALPDTTSRVYSQWVWGNYLGTPLHEAPTEAIPLLADASVLPPAWLGVGELDPLLNDSLLMVEKLKAARVPCEIKRYPGVPHAFVMVNRLYDGARLAISDAATALKQQLNG